MRKINQQAGKIALYFAIIGVLWILTSDRLTAFYFTKEETFNHVQTYKGWLFILSTSIFLYLIIKKLFEKIDQRNIDLAKSLLRYRSTLDNMLEGAQIINFDWEYVYLNDVALEQGRKSKKDLLGKKMMDVYPGIENTQMFKHLNTCMDNRESYKMENEFAYPDGAKGWYELSIQPVPEGIFIFSYDITERVKVEKKLKVGEQRLIEAQRIAKIGDFVWDVNSGEVTWSDPLYELLGYNKKEIVDFNKVNENMHHPDDRKGVNKWLTDSINSNSDELSPKEYRLIRKDSKIIYVITQGRIIRNNSHPVKVFATVQDVTEQKQAEQSLKESEEKYRNLFMNSPDAIFINLNDEIILCNNSFKELMTAKDLSDIIGKSPFDIFQPDIHGLVKERINKVRQYEEDISFHEEKIVNFNGEEVDVEVHRSAFSLGEQMAIHVILRDITEQKRNREIIKENRRRLETLMGNLPGMAYHAKNQEGWPMDFVSDGCLNLTGYTANELVGPNGCFYGDIIYPDDKEYVWNTVQDAISKGEHFVMEYRIKKKNGNVHWVWEQGLGVSVDKDQVHVIEGFVTDINERKIAENELVEHRKNLELLVKQRTRELYKSEEKYRGLYESVKDGIVHVTMSGKILECNPEFSKMLGYSIEELKKQSYRDFSPEKWIEIENEIFENETLKRGYTDEYEKEYIRKDGTIFPVSIRMWLIKDEDDNPKGMWGIIRDISKRKEYEESILNLYKDLEIRQKQLESANIELEAFNYSVSHDLRAPLRAITGFSQILLEDYIKDLEPEAQRLGKVIQDNSEKMGELIDDLLAFSRLGRASLQFTHVDMSNMINSIYYEATSNEIREKIVLKVHNIPPITADTKMMRHVWMNLISNAVKYSSNRDEIRIEISAEQNKDTVIYKIKDNGVGFDMRYKEKLFKVFQRLHKPNEFEGNGVGLPLVQRIVNRHGGEVWGESELGKGATFYFSLPKKHV